MAVLLILAAATAAIWSAGGLEVALGSRRIGFLRDLEPSGGKPRVTVVVAARNESGGVRACLQALLDQRGVDLEIIAVDDRSDDATGAILDELAAGDERLRVLHVARLPPGWLGKSHALDRGASGGGGEWTLFTDADVRLGPEAIAKAVGYADRQRLDHLAVAPELTMPTPATDLFAGVFVLLFARYARPWKARDPNSGAHIGIGAFNLIRSTRYRELGGHSRIRLRPDDDMMLGRLVKEAGFRQDVLYGIGEISVEWYPSLRDAVRGFEKNAFAGLGYSVLAVLSSCLAVLLFSVWPWLALPFTDGWVRGLNLAVVGIMIGLYAQSTRSSGTNPWLAPALPAALIVFCYAVARAAALALARREIRWRGTAYSLEELRRQRP